MAYTNDEHDVHQTASLGEIMQVVELTIIIVYLKFSLDGAVNVSTVQIVKR